MNTADDPGTFKADVATGLGVCDCYTVKNAFGVPQETRWRTLVECAKLPPVEVHDAL